MNARNLTAGVITTAVLALLVGLVTFGRGDPSPSVHLNGGSAWFPTLSQGSIALLDGATGSRVVRIENVAGPDTSFAVEQDGSSALVVDRTRGSVTRVDGATWTASPPIQVGNGADDQLAVRAGGGTAWVVSQGGAVVQQLDTRAMTLIGSPQNLPSAVSDVRVGPDGRLWAVAGSGEVRSFRDGQTETTARVANPGNFSLVLVDGQPVVVDLGTSEATAVDPGSGAIDRKVCLDAPTSTPPRIGGTSGDAPWLLAVSPTKGTLVVSDLEANRCDVIPLGPTADDPRYGTPVEKGRLVFVPDKTTGQAIVVDPAAPSGKQIKARVDLGLAGSDIALLVHADHVWFNEVNGDKAGVITEGLKALSVSKAEAGSSQGQQPGPAPAGQAPAGGQSGASAGGGQNAPRPNAVSTAGGLPAPANSGDNGGGGADGGGGGGGGDAPPAPAPPGGDAVDFTSPAVVVAGEPATFTDITPGDHTVSGWTADGATPASSGRGSKTFATTFNGPGSFNVTLTVDVGGSARSVSHRITVDTQLKVPDLAGFTFEQAVQALSQIGLSLGNQTGVANSVLPADRIVDTNPKKGTVVQRGAIVSYRKSNPDPIAEFQLSSQNVQYNGLAVGPDGNVWVTELDGNKIARISVAGDVREFTVPTPGSRPHSIVAGPDGNLWFTEIGTSRIGRITTQGQFLAEIVLPNGAGPAGIAVGSDGNVWFAQTFRGNVGRIGPNGQGFAEFALPRANTAPVSVVLGADGLIWVAETTTNVIDALNTNGSVGTQVGLRDAGERATRLARGPDAGSPVLYTSQNAVGWLLGGGTVEITTTFRPSGVTTGKDGLIWYSDNNAGGGNGPGEIAASDVHVNRRPPLPVDLFDRGPTLVTAGPGGMLWYINTLANRVGRVTY